MRDGAGMIWEAQVESDALLTEKMQSKKGRLPSRVTL